MRKVTAKQLKQHTGEIIRMLRAGESLILTYRGRTVAVMQPAEEESPKTENRSFDMAWADIEKALLGSKPRFTNWKEATGWMRDRN